jgi:hypothetical protein
MRAQALLLLPALASSSPLVLSFDVVVYGATPAGISAAIVAANGTGLSVALIEPTQFAGGMGGPGGIGFRDIAAPETVLLQNSTIHTWLHMNDVHYGVGSTVWQPDQAVGQANWDALVADPRYNLTVWRTTGLLEGPGAVLKRGSTIQSITTVNTTTEDPSSAVVWAAKVFVDASYEGDVLVAAGVSYTYGRESRDEYNETLAGVQPSTTFSQFRNPVDPFYANGSLLYGVDATLPPVGSADDRVMPYSYRLCVMPNSSGNTVPFPAPAAYDADDFEILIRYANSLVTKGGKGPTFSDLVSQLNYNGYPSSSSRPMRFDLCESGGSAVSTDEPSALYTSYITGNRTVRRLVADRVKYWVLGFVYTLATHPGVPADTRASTSSWGLCKDAWPENGNVPPLMYVREAVRLVGDYVATQKNLTKGVCVPDSIGLGSWTVDAHITRRFVGTIGGKQSAENEGEIGFAPLPGPANTTIYELPYRLITPKRSEATNLLAPGAMSCSHVAFSSIRVEPTYSQLGQGAGAAAAVAARAGVAVQDVDIGDLQRMITGAGQCVHWPECTAVGKC